MSATPYRVMTKILDEQRNVICRRSNQPQSARDAKQTDPVEEYIINEPFMTLDTGMTSIVGETEVADYTLDSM
jgi:23S rRNA maturation mini-RNase III